MRNKIKEIFDPQLGARITHSQTLIQSEFLIANSVKWKRENPSLDSNPRPFLLVKLAQFELVFFDFSHNSKYFYL